jgi:PAS domain S-box-containing protein
MMGGLKRQLNLLAVGVIVAVSLFISLAAVVAMDRLARHLNSARMLSELRWIRFGMDDAHRILKDTGVDTLTSYLDSAQQEIIQRFRDFRIGDTGRLYLVSNDGRIVFAPSDRQANDLGGPELELVIREKVGHAKMMIAGSPSTVYFDTFPEWRWRILLAISEKEINADRDNFILIAIVILLLSACTGVFVFARVANGFVLPILNLAEKLSGMEENQLGQQLEVKHRSKEVGILLNAFRSLSDRLLAAKNKLQQQNEELEVREKKLQSQNNELVSIEAMLRQSEQRHRSILQTAMDGICLLDTQGRFNEVNETYCRMSGYSIQELLTMSISDVECLETASDTAAHIKKVMEQGEDRFESQHRRKEGSVYDVEVSVQYRPADGGQLVVFLQNITERKRAEEQIKASLAEKVVMLKEIHHRVKNNLQVISSLVDMQADNLTDERTREKFDDLCDRIRSMALIHEKLYQTSDLARLNFADYATSLLHALWSSHDVLAEKVRLNLELELVTLSIETAVPCGLILNELAGNALKHAFPNGSDGEVTVGLEHHAATNTACLWVRDTGVGLTPGLDVRRSTSLGLRLVHILAGQLHGTVETRTGPGAEFRMTFPLNGSQS